MHPRAMDSSRPAAQALLACLGEESRFRLVQALMGGARCVTDLAAEVGLSQSCTTRHLQSLERRRLVSGRRDGKRVYYRIREDDPGLMPLLGWALSEPKGAAAIRLRLSRARKGPAARGEARKPERRVHPGPNSDPGQPGRSGSPSPAGPPPREPRAAAARDQQPARPASWESPAPEPPPRPGPAVRLRRETGSDIEDYLL